MKNCGRTAHGGRHHIFEHILPRVPLVHEITDVTPVRPRTSRLKFAKMSKKPTSSNIRSDFPSQGMRMWQRAWSDSTFLCHDRKHVKGVLVQRLCEGVLNRADNKTSAQEGFQKVAGPVWTRMRGLLHAVGGLDG